MKTPGARLTTTSREINANDINSRDKLTLYKLLSKTTRNPQKIEKDRSHYDLATR